MHDSIYGKDPGPFNLNARPGFGRELSRRYGEWSNQQGDHSKQEGIDEHKRIAEEITPDYPSYKEIANRSV